jgi:hypothetical protein
MSGEGPMQRARLAWARTKGKTENGLRAAVQGGMLDLHPAAQRHPIEDAGIKRSTVRRHALPLFRLLILRVTTTVDIGRAMIHAAACRSSPLRTSIESPPRILEASPAHFAPSSLHAADDGGSSRGSSRNGDERFERHIGSREIPRRRSDATA